MLLRFFKKLTAPKRPKPVESEDSIPLRVVTTCMALTGAISVYQIMESANANVVEVSMVAIILGSIVSYYRRDKNNFWLKVGISWGIIIVAGLFFQDLVNRIHANVSDARIPLTSMLVALQGLHCFDLPRRRDLNLSAIVGLALVASTSTLSRSNDFVIYIVSFVVLGSLMLYYDGLSRTRSLAVSSPVVTIAAKPRPQTPALVALFLPLITVAVFLLLPRAEITMLRHVSLAAKFDLSRFASGSIINRGMQNGKSTHADGSISVNPQAYFGFTEDLDLNYRGELSNDIVFRVNSPSGLQWRVMAFDTFDGRHWTMSSPHHTVDRIAGIDSRIALHPLPTFDSGSRYAFARVREVTQTFYVESTQPNLIPVASVPENIYFPAQLIKVDDYGTLRSTAELERDVVYTVDSKVRLFDFSKVRAYPRFDAVREAKVLKRNANCLQLPESLKTEKVKNLATKIVGTGSNWYGEAEKICFYLQNNYKYDLKSPPPPAGENAVSDFLFNSKRGACEQFATSFVALCRTRGIPARLVTGFMPGEYNGLTGLWEVRMSDAHGWAEVYMPRAGWISFDPTPSGVAPGFTGYSKQSTIDYVLEQVRPHLIAFFNQPWLRDWSNAVFRFLNPGIEKFFLWIVVVWKPAVVIAAVLTVLGFVGQKLLHRRLAKNATGKIATGSAQSDECLRLLANVLKEMEQLQLERNHAETVNEYSDRARKVLEDSADSQGPDSLLARANLAIKLEEFSEEYCRTRFGQENDEQLKKLVSTASGVSAAVGQVLQSQHSRN